MALISRDIPSLVQGMSQQDARLRRQTQADFQINGTSDPVYGLGKRPNTLHLAELFTPTTPEEPWVYWIERDTAERYAVVYDGLTLRVYDLDGRSYPVTFADSAAVNYLRSPAPKFNLAATTVGDSTIIANKTKATALSGSTTAADTPVAVVWCRQTNYDQVITFTIDANTIAYTTDGSGVGAPNTGNNTAEMAKEIAAALSSALGGTFTVSHRTGDSVLTVRKTDNSDFDFEVHDSAGGNTYVVGIKNATESFANLPPSAPPDYRVNISGLNDDAADDYWVKFVADYTPGSGLPTGKWVETVAPEQDNTFDASTMPHRLDRLQDTDGTVTGSVGQIYFRLSAITWLDRGAGDAESNKAPGFIGRAISDVFVVQNRLGLISGDRLTLSRADSLFQLWRTTVLSVADDERIDVSVSQGTVLDLQHAISANDELLLVADGAQLVIPVSQGITPSTIRSVNASQLDVDPLAEPLAVAQSVFLPQRGASFSGIREYFNTGDARIKDSVDVTVEVPRLIEGRVTAMASSSAYSTLFVAGSSRNDRIYVYRWLERNRQRAQSAWSFWEFSFQIVSMRVVDGTLYLIARDPVDDSLHLESMQLEPDALLLGQFAPWLVDRLTIIGQSPPPVTPPDPDGDDDDDDDEPVDSSIDRTTPAPPISGGGTGTIGGGFGDGLETPVPVAPSNAATELPSLTPPEEDLTSTASPATGSMVSTFTTPASVGGSILSTTSTPSGISASSGTYDTVTGYTTVSLPWSAIAGVTQVIQSSTGSNLPWIPGPTARTVRIRGDVSRTGLIAGQKYLFRYRFPQAVLFRQTSDGALASITDGRMHLLRWRVNYSRARAFRLLVYINGVLSGNDVFPGRSVGGLANNLPVSGVATTPVLADARDARVEIVTEGPRQTWFTSAAYDADFFKDSRSV